MQAFKQGSDMIRCEILKVSDSRGEHAEETENGAGESSEKGDLLMSWYKAVTVGKREETMDPRDVKEAEGSWLSLSSVLILFISIKWEW